MALSREKILDTAFTLLTQYGLADLSMRRLASELDVAPGALYYHVKNKQELLTHLASRMLDPIEFPQDASTAEALKSAAEQVYRQLAGIRESAEVVRLAVALHPERLELLSALTIACDKAQAPQLAATTLLHSMLSFIEEEQTRATSTGAGVSSQPPASYCDAISAVARGFLAA